MAKPRNKNKPALRNKAQGLLKKPIRGTIFNAYIDRVALPVIPGSTEYLPYDVIRGDFMGEHNVWMTWIRTSPIVRIYGHRTWVETENSRYRIRSWRSSH